MWPKLCAEARAFVFRLHQSVTTAQLKFFKKVRCQQQRVLGARLEVGRQSDGPSVQVAVAVGRRETAGGGGSATGRDIRGTTAKVARDQTQTQCLAPLVLGQVQGEEQ